MSLNPLCDLQTCIPLRANSKISSRTSFRHLIKINKGSITTLTLNGQKFNLYEGRSPGFAENRDPEGSLLLPFYGYPPPALNLV